MARITTLVSSITHPVSRFKLRYASGAKGTLAPVYNYTSKYCSHCSITDMISRDLGIPRLLTERYENVSRETAGETFGKSREKRCYIATSYHEIYLSYIYYHILIFYMTLFTRSKCISLN